MKKKYKIVAGLTACVCALSLINFGFSQWSSDVRLNGSVSAKGSWDVSVTAASMNTSAGAALTYDSFSSKEVFINSYAAENGMNAKIAALKNAGAEIVASDASKQMRQAYISYYDAAGDWHQAEHIGYYLTREEADAACDTASARIREAGGTVYSCGHQTAFYYTVTYSGISSEAAISACSVQYDAVAFSRPGAWAEYAATVTNNGTTAADLSDYIVETSALDAAVFRVDTPDLAGDVLNPGESCTFTVVVQVMEDVDTLNAKAQDFTVELVYAPDAIESAPSASHNHGA